MKAKLKISSLLVLFLCVIYTKATVETCFNTGICIDLTTYEDNSTIVENFWIECELRFPPKSIPIITTSLFPDDDDSDQSCTNQFEGYNEYIVKNNFIQWYNDSDIFAIWMYTGNLYYYINPQLYNVGNVSTEYYYTDLELASGLTRLKVGDAIPKIQFAWRGTSSPAVYNVSYLAVEPIFCSTSYTRSVGYGYAGVGLLVIAHTSGTLINFLSQSPGENEVLFSPGYQFYVLKIDYYTVNQSGIIQTIERVYMYEYNNMTENYSKHQKNLLLKQMIKADTTNASSAVHLSPLAMKKSIIKKTGGIDRSKRDLRGVPWSWSCDPHFYDSQDGCDCDCGDFDPDCDLPSPSGHVLNCLDGASPQCSSSGRCTYLPTPYGWTCEAHHYNSGDGCDCGCGEYDPDCDQDNNGEHILTHCNDGVAIGCDLQGECKYAPEVPEEWVCDHLWYATGDGCDCNCGAFDLDCKDLDQIVMNCPCDGMTCSVEGFCSGEKLNCDEY